MHFQNSFPPRMLVLLPGGLKPPIPHAKTPNLSSRGERHFGLSLKFETKVVSVSVSALVTSSKKSQSRSQD